MESKPDTQIDQFYLQQCEHSSCSVEVKIQCEEWDIQDYQYAERAIEDFDQIKVLLKNNFYEREPFKGPLTYQSDDGNFQIILAKTRDTQIVQPCRFRNYQKLSNQNFDQNENSNVILKLINQMKSLKFEMDLYFSKLMEARKGHINNQDELIRITQNASEFVSRLSKSNKHKTQIKQEQIIEEFKKDTYINEKQKMENEANSNHICCDQQISIQNLLIQLDKCKHNICQNQIKLQFQQKETDFKKSISVSCPKCQQQSELHNIFLTKKFLQSDQLQSINGNILICSQHQKKIVMKSQIDDTLACFNCLKNLNIQNFEEFEEEQVINHFKNLQFDIQKVIKEVQEIEANLQNIVYKKVLLNEQSFKAETENAKIILKKINEENNLKQQLDTNSNEAVGSQVDQKEKNQITEKANELQNEMNINKQIDQQIQTEDKIIQDKITFSEEQQILIKSLEEQIEKDLIKQGIFFIQKCAQAKKQEYQNLELIQEYFQLMIQTVEQQKSVLLNIGDQINQFCEQLIKLIQQGNNNIDKIIPIVDEFKNRYISGQDIKEFEENSYNCKITLQKIMKIPIEIDIKNKNNFDQCQIFQLILIGGSLNKSLICQLFFGDNKLDDSAVIGRLQRYKWIKIDDILFKNLITVGGETSISDFHVKDLIKKNDCIFLCYDITTYLQKDENIKEWNSQFERIEDQIGNFKKDFKEDVILYLIGIQRTWAENVKEGTPSPVLNQEQKEFVIKFVKTHNINRHFEISVTKQNADLIFSCAFQDVFLQKKISNNQIKNEKKKQEKAIQTQNKSSFFGLF